MSDNTQSIMGRSMRWWHLAIASIALLGFVDCTPDPNGGYLFLCEQDLNGAELCHENRVRYCHYTSNGHFHTGQNCEKQGLKCLYLGDKKAVCIDESKPCNGSDFKCDSNTAYNCIDGTFAIKPCGTAKTCETKASEAWCKPKQEACGGNGEEHDGKCECFKGFKVDPQDDKNCIAE